MGRKSYDRGWAWRIIYLSLGTLAGLDALAPQEVVDQMAAEHMPVGIDYVRSCLDRFDRRGDPWTTRDSLRRDGRRATDSQRRWIKKTLRRNPSLYFDEISQMFRRKYGRTISDEMISQALKHDGGRADDRPLSLKVLQVVARQRNAAKRLECQLGLQGLEPECMIILDESHIADKDYRRRRGWAPVGEPANIYEYFSGDGKLRSVLAAVNQDGFVTEACKVVEGGVGDDEFMKWARESLSPVLKPYDENLHPNSIVVLDNAIIHHQPEFVEMLEDIGCLVFYLSPYSPDFSAIELCFHQMKAWLKRNQEAVRADPQMALVEAMEESVTAENMTGYFRKCGYPLKSREESNNEEAVGLILCTVAAMAAVA
eukprot:COSAG02_NODE_743_length_17764_cov_9.908916_7_plen_370_part_00